MQGSGGGGGNKGITEAVNWRGSEKEGKEGRQAQGHGSSWRREPGRDMRDMEEGWMGFCSSTSEARERKVVKGWERDRNEGTHSSHWGAGGERDR